MSTHCGVVSTVVDGDLWIADPPLGDHNPPPGWGENATLGYFILSTRRRAIFRGEGGQTALFRKAEPGESDPGAGCE